MGHPASEERDGLRQQACGLTKKRSLAAPAWERRVILAARRAKRKRERIEQKPLRSTRGTRLRHSSMVLGLTYLRTYIPFAICFPYRKTRSISQFQRPMRTGRETEYCSLPADEVSVNGYSESRVGAARKHFCQVAFFLRKSNFENAE